MPSFHYVALSPERKELSGVIEADNEAAAREQLSALGIAVVSLIQTAGAGVQNAAGREGKIIFDFNALDKNQKRVEGTIASGDLQSAFNRLTDEYQLNVTKISKAGSALDINALLRTYETTHTAANAQEEAVRGNARKKELIAKVDFTMAAVSGFLQKYERELKDEERDTIRSYLNQLMRIKDSTNLEHIKSTCERMLTHIQKRELFLHEEERTKESSKLKVETQEMLKNLKRGGLQKDINLEFILKYFRKPNPEIIKLKQGISAANSQIWTYIKLFLTAKSGAVKAEAKEAAYTLLAERSRLKKEIRSIKLAAKLEENQQRDENIYIRHAAEAAGWTLALYIAVYIIAYPFTIKNFGVSVSLPNGFYFYSGTATKAATLLLFIAYSAHTIKKFWLKGRTASMILYPAAIFMYLLIAVNLM